MQIEEATVIFYLLSLSISPCNFVCNDSSDGPEMPPQVFCRAPCLVHEGSWYP